MDEQIQLTALEQQLGYPFTDKALLETALTHRSYCTERHHCSNNERLEFLGDAVLELVISSLLFHKYSDHYNEGDLTRMRAWLVNESSLSSIAADLQLGDYLRLGKGEEKTGGRNRPSILADALEAIIGAVYIDSGFETAHRIIEKLFRQRLPKAPEGLKADFKSRLQEKSQKELGLMPVYQLIDTSGPDHDRKFKITVFIGDFLSASGIGKSKKEAEQNAARKALELYKNRKETS